MGDSGASRRALHLKALYLEGDLDLAAYRAQKAGVAAELAALPLGEGNPDERVGRRLADFLADLASASRAAQGAIARLLRRGYRVAENFARSRLAEQGIAPPGDDLAACAAFLSQPWTAAREANGPNLWTIALLVVRQPSNAG